MEAQGPDLRAGSIADAIADAQVHAPTRGNRKLEGFLEAVNADERVRAQWYMAQLTSERLGMSDHSWVHVQVVLNIGLRLLRLLVEAGVVRVADALDMAQGRSRIPFEAGQIGIHSLSAAAIDEVKIEAGDELP